MSPHQQCVEMTAADGVLPTFWNISHSWSVWIGDDTQFHTALDCLAPRRTPSPGRFHHKTSRLAMNTTFGKSTHDRYSAKSMAKPVNFFCSAPAAQSVCLVGDFNGWNSLANPMDRQADGCWYTQVQLTHGHHRYCFLVDGEPALDPRGSGITRNERNERVSLIAVS